MIEFIWLWAFLLLPLPLLSRWLLPAANKNEKMQALTVPFWSTLAAVVSEQPTQKHDNGNRQLLLLSLIWLCLVLALARPQWLGERVSIPITGRDMLLAIDVSGSMETPDLLWKGQRLARLDVVKAVAADFIAKRHGDRLGLILFGSGAYLQSPLSYDLNTVQQFLAEAIIGLAGERTAIGDAIGLAVKQLQDNPSDHRVLVLLTDGENNSGQVKPEQAAKMAKEFNLQVYTIGVGANALQVQSLLGSHTINPSADLDEGLLRELAAMTGGKYFRATDTASLAAIYQAIDQLQPIESDPQTFRPIESLYHWPLSAALLLSLLFIALHIDWRRFSLARKKY